MMDDFPPTFTGNFPPRGPRLFDTGKLPEYPVDRDERLEGHYFTKFWHDRWLNSQMHLTASLEVQACALNLFFLSQKQTPVGTLPDDETILAKMLRIDLVLWRDLRARQITPLHGWSPCRCGDEMRLAHPVVPVIILDDLSEAQRRALVIADNKLAENAGWDEELLRVELAALGELDFDLDLLGFSDEELENLLGDLDGMALGETEGEDDVPEAPEDPTSRPGDLWILGKHRLLCGDATVATDVERVLNGIQPLLMVTDPPYGVQYDPAWRNQMGAAKTERTGKVLNDDRADWREAWDLFPGDVSYVWNGALHATTVAESLEAAGFNVRSQIIWAKDRLVLSRGDYHWQHEPCWYAVKKTGKGHWAGDRKQTTLWRITYVNDKFCERSGYSRDELIGQNHRILKSGAHDPEFYAEMYRTLSSGNIWSGEIQNRQKDGSFYWVKSTIAPQMEGEGSLKKFVSIRTDITQTKQDQAALNMQEFFEFVQDEVYIKPLLQIPRRQRRQCWKEAPTTG